MPREKTRDGQSPSRDIGWKFAVPVPNARNKLNCKLCGREITGGITRLKQHLTHQRGQVAPCDSVSAEIKTQMMKHLLGTMANQAEKREKRKEVSDYIRSTQYGDDYEGAVAVSSDDEDPKLTIALKESGRMRNESEERQRFKASGDRYHEGSSSGLPQQSASVREPRDGKQWVDPNTLEAILEAVDVDLHRGKGPKQTKISSTPLKTLRRRLGAAVSQFVIFGRHSANVVRNPWFEPMLNVAREVGKGVKPPTPYEIPEVYLPQEFESLKKWIESHKPIWEERGVTIMCDGWTGPTRKHIINFLVHSNRGTIFHRSVDATDVVSRTADYYFGLMDRVVDEIGEKYVVQIVTDNEAAMKLAGKKLMQKRPNLYWTGCAAHCIDLMLHDISKKKNLEKVLDSARKITSFIYNFTWVVDFMKRFTGGRELLRPAITRFATNFITLESIVRFKKSLVDMFHSDDWKQSRWAKLPKAKEVRKIIHGNDFWAKAVDIMKVQEPLVKVLRLVDGDEKPTMGFIYEAMDRARLAIQRDCRYWKDYLKIIDKRWEFQLHHDLHSAGYYLNPQFQYGEAISNQRDVMDGVKKVIQRLEPIVDNQIRAINQILMFRDKQDSYGTVLAQRAVLQTNPAEWWIHYGSSAPELQQIAVKVLSQTTSSSNCERNWSTFSLIHTKSRNRLKSQKLNQLVYVYYNMRLKIRHATRRSQKQIEDDFNPINLDYIFDEDDPLSPWLQEREEPVLDGQDNSEWLNVDDEDSHDGANTTVQVPSANGSGSDGSGLSPPSDGSDGGGDDDDGDNGGVQQQYEGGTSSSPYHGEIGLHGFQDNAEIGEPIPLQWGGSRRRTSQRPTEVSGAPVLNLVDHFGVLGMEGHPHSQPNYLHPQGPTYNPHALGPQYHPTPPYHMAYPQPQYIPAPPAPLPPPPPSQSYQHGYLHLVVPMPENYFDQQLQQHRGESSGSNSYEVDDNYYFGYGSIQQSYTEDNGDGIDIDLQSQPPRHSFWW